MSDLNLCGVTSDGKLWHTIRFATGSWAPSFGDVKAQESNNPGTFTAISGAVMNSLDLHLCGVTSDGKLWHTIRFANSWQSAFGDVKAQATNNPGTFTAISCAAMPNSDLNLYGVTSDGKIWHMVRSANGSWAPSFGNVNAQESNNPGTFTAISCAAMLNDDRHVCGVTSDGKLWHTVHFANGSWNPAFGDVKAQATNNPGTFTAISTVSAPNGDLNLCGVTSDGKLWHIIRFAAGNWQSTFTDIKAQRSNNPGAFTKVSCALASNGDLSLCGVTSDGKLWHTIRFANGSWAPAFGDVKGQESNNPGAFLNVCVADSPVAPIAVTASTLVQSSTLPMMVQAQGQQAQSQPAPVITLHHQGGYVATCTVEYDADGRHQSQSSGNITSGQTYSVPLPTNATNIHVKCEEATGLVWEPWRAVIDQIYPNALQKSFTITGTTLSPNFTVEDGSGLTQQTTFTFINDLNRPVYVAVHHLGDVGLPWRDGKPKCWDQTLQLNQSATYAPDSWIVHFSTWMTLIADGLFCIVAIAATIASGGATAGAAAEAIALTASEAAAAAAEGATSVAVSAVAATEVTAAEASAFMGEVVGEAVDGATSEAVAEFATSGAQKALTRVASALGMDAQQFSEAVGPYIQMAQKYGSTVAKVLSVVKDAVVAGVAVNSYKALEADGWALYVEIDGHGTYVSNFIVSGGNYYIPISLAIGGLAIEVDNKGGYVARCTVAYDLNGQHQSQSSNNFPVAQSYSQLVPAGATNIHVTCEEETGLVWAPWKTVVDQTYPGPAKFATYKTLTLSGTTLNPNFAEAGAD